jgi:hypothetical protein
MSRVAYYADAIGEHRSVTPEGYLIAKNIPISRTGWQTYRAADLQGGDHVLPGIKKLDPHTPVNVYRSEQDVFDPVAISSFEGKSITKYHPGGLLTHDNDRDHAIGHIQNVRRGPRLPDGEYALIADLWFKDAQSIVYVQNGVMDQLSCGYTYTLVEMDDEHSPYTTYKMTEIRGNHVALVPAGRAGQYVKVLDASPEGGTEQMELKDFTEFFKTLGLRLTPTVANDSESETVEKQKEKDAEALKLKERTMDAEKEKELKDAVAAADKRAKDAEEKIEEVKKAEQKQKEATDARFAATDARIAKLLDALEEKMEDAKECTCGAKGEEAHDDDCPVMASGANDAELIPTKTLTGKEVPENPIPGADRAMLTAELKRMKPVIADSGDPAAIDSWNKAWKALKKGVKAADSDYAKILAAASHESDDAKRQRELAGVRGLDAPQVKQGDYAEMMRKLHRTNLNVTIQ